MRLYGADGVLANMLYGDPSPWYVLIGGLNPAAHELHVMALLMRWPIA